MDYIKLRVGVYFPTKDSLRVVFYFSSVRIAPVPHLFIKKDEEREGDGQNYSPEAAILLLRLQAILIPLSP